MVKYLPDKQYQRNQGTLSSHKFNIDRIINHGNLPTPFYNIRRDDTIIYLHPKPSKFCKKNLLKSTHISSPQFNVYSKNNYLPLSSPTNPLDTRYLLIIFVAESLSSRSPSSPISSLTLTFDLTCSLIESSSSSNLVIWSNNLHPFTTMSLHLKQREIQSAG